MFTENPGDRMDVSGTQRLIYFSKMIKKEKRNNELVNFSFEDSNSFKLLSKIDISARSKAFDSKIDRESVDDLAIGISQKKKKKLKHYKRSRFSTL